MKRMRANIAVVHQVRERRRDAGFQVVVISIKRAKTDGNSRAGEIESGPESSASFLQSVELLPLGNIPFAPRNMMASL